MFYCFVHMLFGMHHGYKNMLIVLVDVCNIILSATLYADQWLVFIWFLSCRVCQKP